MKAAIKRDINRTYLIIEKPIPYLQDYQVNMLRMNQLKGLLPISGRGVDASSQYHYEISGKVSMKAMYEKAKMEHEDMKRFMNQLLETMRLLRSYMLDVNKLILEPEYIFYAEQQFYFCYFPVQTEPLCQIFHELTEYFVGQTNYEDKDGIFLAYELHKATMEENYNIEQINERIVNKIKKQKEPEIRNIDPAKYEKFYNEDDWDDEKGVKTDIEKEDDWIETMSTGVQALRERADEWKPIKYLKKRIKDKKKTKWGEWEDL